MTKTSAAARQTPYGESGIRDLAPDLALPTAPTRGIAEAMNRRALILSAVVVTAFFGTHFTHAADADLADIRAQIAKQHDRAVTRLQEWIRLPSIAAENRGFPNGAEHMAKLLKEVGFQRVDVVTTDGKPGVFATLDAGAAKTVGLYFMYDVKQFDPKEWSSPPLDAALVDRPGLGKVIVGRGAVNQKGPQSALLAALDAFRGAGKRRGGDRFAAHRPDRAPA